MSDMSWHAPNLTAPLLTNRTEEPDRLPDFTLPDCQAHMLDTDLRRMCKTAVLVYSESLNRLCTMWHDFQYILGDLLFYLFGGLSLYVYIYIYIYILVRINMVLFERCSRWWRRLYKVCWIMLCWLLLLTFLSGLDITHASLENVANYMYC